MNDVTNLHSAIRISHSAIGRFVLVPRLEFIVNGEARSLDLEQQNTTLGRGVNNILRLEDQDVSRNHAAVIRSSEGYVLQDLNSRNGVLVNGRKHERCLLQSGDRITIGSYVFKFVNEESEDGSGTVLFGAAKKEEAANARSPASASAGASAAVVSERLGPPELPTTEVQLSAVLARQEELLKLASAEPPPQKPSAPPNPPAPQMALPPQTPVAAPRSPAVQKPAPVKPPAPAPATPPPPVTPKSVLPESFELEPVEPDPAEPEPEELPRADIFFPLESLAQFGVPSTSSAFAGYQDAFRVRLSELLREPPATPDHAIVAMLGAAAGALGADRAALILNLPEGGLKLVGNYPRTARPSISRVVLSATLRHGQAVLCNHAYRNEHFRTSPSVLRERLPALLAMPLLQGSEPIAFLYLDSTCNPDLFRPEHLSFLGSVGQSLLLMHAGSLGLRRDQAAHDGTEIVTIVASLNARYMTGSKRREKKIAALSALGQCNRSEAIAPLVAHLVDNDPKISEAAGLACIGFGTKACPRESLDLFHGELLSLLASDIEPGLRARVVDVLSRLQPERAPLRDSLARFVADPTRPAPARAAIREMLQRREANDSTFFLSSDAAAHRK